MNSNDLSLNGQWRLTCDDGRTFPATVPGDVILDLMLAGAVSDPNIRDNFRECRELGEHIWSYEKDFSLRLHPGTRYILWFDGLAYVAEILVNGTPAGHHKSMHRPRRAGMGKAKGCGAGARPAAPPQRAIYNNCLVIP